MDITKQTRQRLRSEFSRLQRSSGAVWASFRQRPPLQQAIMATAMMILAVLLIAGGASLLQPASQSPPEIRLQVGGETISGIEGSYCWGQGSKALCVDKIGPAALYDAPGIETVSIRPATEIGIETPEHTPPPVYVYTAYDADGEVVTTGTTSQQRFSLDVPDGTYLLGVQGDWLEGDMTYFFRVRMVR